MRGLLGAVCCAIALVSAGPAAAQTGPVDAGPLRLDDLQARGTHNSYHQDPAILAQQAGWDYSHLPLDRQLEEQGVRQVELDVHYNWARDVFEVYHAWGADDRSTCDLLQDCLAALRGWSDAHPAHHPLVVLVEPKDNGPPKNTELPEDMDLFTRPFTQREYGLLDQVLLSGFGRARTLTPDDVTVPGQTLRASILDRGWPALDALRGKVLFVLDGDDHAVPYTQGFTSLSGRAMFVQPEADRPVAAFVSRDGARQPGEGKYDRMARLVRQGFLVRDLPSAGEVDAAKAAGAHFLSTDFPERLALSPDPEAPSRCNPVSAPGGCQDRALETHARGDWRPASRIASDGLAQVATDKALRLGCGTARSVVALVTRQDPRCPVRIDARLLGR